MNTNSVFKGVFMFIDSIIFQQAEKYKADFDSLKKKHTQLDRVNKCAEITKQILLEAPIYTIDNELHVFNGKIYEPISEKELSVAIYNTLCEFGVGALDAKRTPDLTIPILSRKRKDINPNIIAFNNVIFDVENNTAIDFDESLVTTYSVGYDYSEGSENLLWQNFLNEVLPNINDQRILQEFIGLCYIDRRNISIEKALLVYGKGANGKSVVFDVITALLGNQYVCELSPAQLNDDKQIIALRGKKLNFAPDVKANSAFTSALKALISGQCVQGWDLYKGNVPIIAPPLIFAFNEMPDFLDKSHGFFRRLIPLHFAITIPPEMQDKQLASKICQNLSGVFNWAIEGRRRLLKQNGEFTTSDNSQEELSKIKLKMSPVLSYMERNGFHPHPLYPNQPPKEIATKTIMDALNLTGKQISSELTQAGYKNIKRGVSYYQVYLNIDSTNFS